METQQVEIFKEEVQSTMNDVQYFLKEEISNTIGKLLDYWMCAIDSVSWNTLEKIDSILTQYQ